MNLPKCDVSLAYLEGMREALECVKEHSIETLGQRIFNLEKELGYPGLLESKNPLRIIQGLEKLNLP